MEEVKSYLLKLGFKNNSGSCYYEYNGKMPNGEDTVRIGIHIFNWNHFRFSARVEYHFDQHAKITLERCVLRVTRQELNKLLEHFHVY